MNSQSQVDASSTSSENRGQSLGKDRDWVADESFQIAVLAIGEDSIGINQSELLRVVDLPMLIPCFPEPHWLLGVADVSGEWIAVVSMQQWLWGATPALTDSSKLALVRAPLGPMIGLLIESVIGFRDVSSVELAERAEISPISSYGPVRAITQDMLQLIDVASVCAHPALSAESMRRAFFTGQ